MSTKRPLDQHLTSEEAFHFMEKSLSKRHLGQVEEHLDGCLDCVEYLATVTRSARAVTRDEEEELGRVPARTPQELLDELRPQILASCPRTTPLRAFPWRWRQWVPVAAVAAVLFAALAWLQIYVIAPSRGRQLAEKAVENLVSIRQGTGRIPLRYIPEFLRARVTRSGFDTVHPAEAAVEEQLRHAVDLAPKAAETHLALGLFLLDKGALDEAQHHLEEAVAIDGDSVLATNGLAVVHYERAIREPSRAMVFLRKAITLLQVAQRQSPDDLQVAFNLAALYEEAGAAELAKEHWRAYLEMDPASEWGEVAAEKLDDLEGR